MNDLIEENRYCQFSGANLKKKWTHIVTRECFCQKLKPFYRQINIEFLWICQNKRRDKDNIMAAQKFIFDGLVKARVIKNDGWKEIGSINHKFTTGNYDSVEIVMEEV